MKQQKTPRNNKPDVSGEDAAYALQINILDKKGDPESAHLSADDLLCEILKKLGYTKTVEAFEKLQKWYA